MHLLQRKHRPMWRRPCLLALILLAGLASDAAAGGIRWRKDLEAAQREAAESGRFVLMHYWATWCGPCMKLEKEVFNQPQVGAAIEQHFVPVKIDVDQHPQIARQYKIKPIPADVIILPNGQVVGGSVGFFEAPEYVERLATIAMAAKRQAPGSSGGTRLADRGAGSNPPIEPPGATLPGQQQEAVIWHDQRSPLEPKFGNPQQGPGQPISPGGQNPIAPPGGPYSPYPPRQQFTPGGQTPGPSPQLPPWAPRPNRQPPTAPETPNTPPPPTNNQLPPGYPFHIPPSSPQPDPRTGPPTAPRQQTPPPQAPPQQKLPPMGFDGYCLISMHEHEVWVKGDPRWGAIHEGRLYFFSNLEARDQFLAEPLRYAPAFSEHDVVLFAETGQRVSGQRRYGAQYQADGEPAPRIYLFSSEDTLKKFEQNPIPYVARIRGLGQPYLPPAGQ